MNGAAMIVAAVRGRDVRAADVLAAAERRHAATHGRLNALVQPRFAAARAEAAAVGGDLLPLGGLPVSVKECFPVCGLATTLGIEARRAVRDTADAALVARLRALGAVVVGKANVPQAMFLHETDNPVWGRTNHPADPDRGPGGSSGGDAALVAAGVVPLGVGNDLAGSLRQPAHACGIAALVPRSAVLGEGGAVDTLPHLEAVRPRAGFLATRAADLRLALHAVVRGTAPAVPGAAAGLRIGWWTDAGPIPPSAAIVRAVGTAVDAVTRAGAVAVPLDAAIAREAAWLHLGLLGADGGADVRRLFGGAAPIAGVARLLRLAAVPRRVRPWLAALAWLAGRRIEAEALARTGPCAGSELEALLVARADLARRFAALVAGVDAIVCPVSALPALRHGTAARLVLAAAPCLLANLLDLPAGAVPVSAVRGDEEEGRRAARDPVLRCAAECDRGSAGLPVGVQVVGCPGRDEDVVLDVMAAVEAAGQEPSRATIARGI